MLRNALRATPLHRLRAELPLKGEGYSVRGRVFNSPRFDLSALCDLYPILPLIPHAVVVSPPSAWVKGVSLAALFFSGEGKTGRHRRCLKSSVRNPDPTDGRFVNHPHRRRVCAEGNYGGIPGDDKRKMP